MSRHLYLPIAAALTAACLLHSLPCAAGGMIYQPAPPVSPQGYGYPAVPGYNVPTPGNQYLAPGAPPAPQQEIIIASPGPGYQWTGGYWHWQNGWIWIPGQWALPPRPGVRWFGPNWVPHHEGGFRMEHGGWR